jgi:hypothetical protein
VNLRVSLLSLALCASALAAPSVSLALEFGVDPAVGTWKLNLEKSKPDPAVAAPKSSVRTYVAMPSGLRVRIRTVEADGSEHLIESSFSYDGKLHAVTGTPDYDNVAVTRVSRFESHTRLIQDGKAIGQLNRVVSADGKTLTIIRQLTTNKGTAEHDVLVFDRQ